MEKIIKSGRILSVIRFFRIFDSFYSENDEVKKQITNIINTLIMLVLVNAGLIQLFEKEEVEILLIKQFDLYLREALLMRTQYHHYIYFTVVTMSTVGYGDIIPITIIAKIIVMLLIIAILVVIPKQTNDLVQLLGLESEYAKKKYKARNDIPHIIITGNVTLVSLKSFCQELFHPDHGKQTKHAVIINNELPNREMEKFLNEPENDKNLIYLEGDPMSNKDLIRADIGKAKACIIFNDKLSNDPHSSDHQNLLLGIFIKKFVYNYNIEESSLNKNFRLCMQLVKSENKYHYFNTLQDIYCKNMQPDQLILIEEIKLNLLSKSCLTPGILAMMSNLLISSAPLPLGEEKEWLKEFSDGKNHEIYRVGISIENNKDKTFIDIVKDIYNDKEDQVITFALEIEIDKESILRLNPGNILMSSILSQLMEKEKYNHSIIKFYVYLICSDKMIAESISKKNEACKSIRQSFLYTSNPHNWRDKQIFTDLEDSENDTNSDIEEINKNNQQSSTSTEDYDIDPDKFFIRKNPSDFQDEKDYEIMHHTVKESLDIQNHIVVCGIHSSIVHFILPLRSRSIGYENLKYIVFLSPVISPKIYEWLTKFPKIIFILGSPLLPENLYRANIMNADKAAILSKINDFQMQDLKTEMQEIMNNDNAENENEIKSVPSKYSDAEAIFIYKAIKKCNKNIQIVTDLISTENIEYLLNKKFVKTISFRKDFLPLYEYTPLFASGEVFFPGIIDRITCQSYFNPHILAILKKLMIGGGSSKNKKLHRLEEELNIPDSVLWLIKVPESLINESFEKLFNHLIKGSFLISLGLYRKNIIDNFYYVYTNPSKSTLIQKEDYVYVLGLNSSINDLIEDKVINKSEKNSDDDTGKYNNDTGNDMDKDNSDDSSVKILKNNNNKNGFNNLMGKTPRNNFRKGTVLLQKNNNKKNEEINFMDIDSNGYIGNSNNKKDKFKHMALSKKPPLKLNLNLNKSESKRKTFLRSLSIEKISTKHIEIENLNKRINKINDSINRLRKEYENFPNLIEKVIDQEINKEFKTIICDD
jgi:hypothetical protein